MLVLRGLHCISASIGAVTIVLMLAIITANILQIANRTVDVAVIRFSAMVAVTDDYILICTVNWNRNAFIKHITFAVKEATLDFRIFTVGDNTTLKLGDVGKYLF
ncbi:hypothetical protein D3C77_679140 [compost metagenome]